MTRLEIYEAVRGISNRPNLSATVLGYLLSMLEGELNRVLREHPRNKTSADVTPTGDSDQITLPTSLNGLLALKDSDGYVYPEYSSDAELDDDVDHGYIDRGSHLEITPAFVDGSGLTYTLYYYTTLTALSTDGASNWISTYFSDVYVWGLLRNVATHSRDPDMITIWAKAFDEAVNALRLQGWDQNTVVAPRTRRLIERNAITRT